MKKKTTIAMAFPEKEITAKELLPSLHDLKYKLVNVKKKALKKSLSELLIDMNEILESLPVLNKIVTLDQASIAVQITAEGGIAWVASASAGLSNSITLTFKIKS